MERAGEDGAGSPTGQSANGDFSDPGALARRALVVGSGVQRGRGGATTSEGTGHSGRSELHAGHRVGPDVCEVRAGALVGSPPWRRAGCRTRRGKGKRGVLVTGRLADVKPPLGFRGHQLADLAAWDGGTDDREFQRLLRGIEAHLRPRSSRP